MTTPQDILSFWFGDDPDQPAKNSKLWWKKDPQNDGEIKDKFLADLEAAKGGQLEAWKDTPEGTLAFIILIDQFSRNIYRDRAAAFGQDKLAQQACLEGIEKGFDQKIPHVHRAFFYLPLMHSEAWEHHEKALEIYRQLAESCPAESKKMLEANHQYAISHAKIVKQFGRYPHRNKILGRQSTPEEAEFLTQPGSSF